MYKHYYQSPYRYEPENEQARTADVIVPQTIYEEEEPEQEETLPDAAEEEEKAPPHSKTPFNVGANIYNPQTKRFLDLFALDDIIIVALIILFMSDAECDNILLIILAFIFLTGLGGEKNGLPC